MGAERAPLVGREVELGQLRQALDRARGGQPGVVVVAGEAGIGKSRLLQELIAAHDGLVAVGHCSPVTSTRLPYGPVVELVSALLASQPDLQDTLSAEAWRAVSLLTGGPAYRPHAHELHLGSTRIFAGVADVVTLVSAQQPLLLVVEDVHWADPASIDLIAFLARRLRDQRVVVVLTHRPAGAPPRSPVRSALAEIGRLESAQVIGLGPLSGDAVRKLLATHPRLLTDERAERIAERSEGIPFFALHLATQDEGQPIPDQLRDVLMSSFDALSPQERALLILLTVVGADEVTALLATVGSPGDISRLARGLIDRGLLVLRDGVLGYRHALLRDLMVDDTFPTERVLAHAQAADALLASPAAQLDVRAGQLAHHLLECGRHGDAVRAARRATALWAFADAQDLYRGVRRLWSLVEDPEQLVGLSHSDLLTEAALVSRWCGDLDDALALLDDALRLGRHAEMPAGERARTEHVRGQVLWAAGDMNGSLDAYRRAEALLPAGADDGLRSAVLAALAQGLMATGHAQEARSTAAAAATLAAAAGAERERVHARITEAAAQAQLGDVDAAVDGLRGVLPDARRLDDLELVLRCYGNLTFALGIGARFAELAAAAEEGARDCGRYGPVMHLASTLTTNQMSALVALGRWDEAVEVGERALAAVSATKVAVHARISLAQIAVARGDLSGGEAYLEQVGGLGGGDPYTSSALCVVRAERALWEHDPLGARAWVAQALPVLEAQDDALPLLEACWLGLRAVADLSESPVTPRRASGPTPGADLLVIARGATDRTELAAATWLACLAEGTRISGSDDVEAWLRAAEANERLSRPYVRAYCLLRLGAVHLHRHARSAATPVLQEGLGLAEALRAAPLVAEFETLVRVSGIPRTAEAPPDKLPAAYGLTPRELEVLPLLTTGATNRMIARKLFITERTASVHVSNILTKLGVSNRTEAARMALTMNLDSHVPQ